MTTLRSSFSEIQHEQRKRIFALSREANISNDILHQYMISWAGVSSLREDKCTFHQANKIIEALSKCVKKRKSSGSAKAGGATEKQINAIKTIQRILGWNDGRINGFIEHTAYKRGMEYLTVPEASKVIIGLRKMVKNQPTIWKL